MADIQRDRSADSLRANTESLLLFLIGELGQTYGYRLIKEARERSGGFLRFKEGTVYPALRKLENEGFIHGEWQLLDKWQRRRLYTITDKGKEAIGARLALWKQFVDAVDMVLRPAKS